MADSPVDLIASATAEAVTNRFAQAAERMIADAQDEELTEDDIAAGLWELSDSALDQDAAEAVRDAIRGGRGDELNGLKESGDIPEGAIWRRSALLDQNTCDECEAADGEELDGPDDDLSEICAGDAMCRCMPYSDLSELSDEEAAAVEADTGDEGE